MREIGGINRTLYQKKKSQGQGQQQVRDRDNKGVDEFWFIFVGVTTASLAEAREVPYGYSAPKIRYFGPSNVY